MKELKNFNVIELTLKNKANINGGDTGGEVAHDIGVAVGYTVGGVLILAAKTVEMFVDLWPL